MQISLVRIGNSKGIRLAKAILDQYQITDKVELVLKEGFIVLKPIQTPRAGWEAAFEKMHKEGGDKLLIDDVFADETFED